MRCIHTTHIHNTHHTHTQHTHTHTLIHNYAQLCIRNTHTYHTHTLTYHTHTTHTHIPHTHTTHTHHTHTSHTLTRNIFLLVPCDTECEERQVCRDRTHKITVYLGLVKLTGGESQPAAAQMLQYECYQSSHCSAGQERPWLAVPLEGGILVECNELDGNYAPESCGCNTRAKWVVWYRRVSRVMNIQSRSQ